MKRVLLIAGASVVLGACSGRQNQADREARQFDCRDRTATYIASKHIAGAEIGVTLTCVDGPRIKRWKTGNDGKQVEDDHPLSPVDFDKTWREIDATGWPNLRDCANGSLEKTDPIYRFDIKDDTNAVSFTCQTREVPYPYNDITDALDLMAAKGQGQLGDDEPPEAKALDKKDKNR